MASTVPKPPGQRRNRNKRPESRMLTAPVGDVPPVPENHRWSAEVVDWWNRVWASPIAGAWDPVVDLATVQRLGDVYAQLTRPEAPASLHAVAGRLESELLLSPRARKAAYVQLNNEPAPPPEPSHPRAAERMRITENGAMLLDENGKPTGEIL